MKLLPLLLLCIVGCSCHGPATNIAHYDSSIIIGGPAGRNDDTTGYPNGVYYDSSSHMVGDSALGTTMPVFNQSHKHKYSKLSHNTAFNIDVISNTGHDNTALGFGKDTVLVINGDTVYDNFWFYFRDQLAWFPNGGEIIGNILDHVPKDSLRAWTKKKTFDSLVHDFYKP